MRHTGSAWLAAANAKLTSLRGLCVRLLDRARPRTRVVTLSAADGWLVASTASGERTRCHLADVAGDTYWSVKIAAKDFRSLRKLLANQSGLVTVARTAKGLRVSGPTAWLDVAAVERSENRLHALMHYARTQGIAWPDVRSVAQGNRTLSR